MLNQTERFTFRATPDLLRKVDHCADKMGLSRNQLMNNLLACSVEDLLLLDKLGLLTLGAAVRDLLITAKDMDDLNSIDPERC